MQHSLTTGCVQPLARGSDATDTQCRFRANERRHCKMTAPPPQARLRATLSALRPARAPTTCMDPAVATRWPRRTRVAIIGLGRQGSTICDEMPAGSPPYGIAGACRQSSVLEVVAGADLLEDKRSAFQERWGGEIPGEMRCAERLVADYPLESEPARVVALQFMRACAARSV